jgi:hypothetical protein
MPTARAPPPLGNHLEGRVDVVLAWEGVGGELGSKESSESSRGACLQQCFEIVTGIELKGPRLKWGSLATLGVRLADENGFRALKVSKWFGPDDTKMLVDEHGRWHGSGIQHLCELATRDFAAILKVAIACEDCIDNENHCAAVVDGWLIDPEDKIRRPLCPASFDALKITKILGGIRLVKKSSDKKRKRHQQEEVQQEDAASEQQEQVQPNGEPWWRAYPGVESDPGPFLP